MRDAPWCFAKPLILVVIHQLIMCRSAIRAIFMALVCCLSTSAKSAEQTGIVCLGENLAIPLDEHTQRLYLKIDDSPKIYFLSSFNPPLIVVEGLDLKSSHNIYVFFEGKIAQSWKLNFRQLGAKAALIWRSAGSWRMEPIDAGLCRRDE